jgi:hypothetical protein
MYVCVHECIAGQVSKEVACLLVPQGLIYAATDDGQLSDDILWELGGWFNAN